MIDIVSWKIGTQRSLFRQICIINEYLHIEIFILSSFVTPGLRLRVCFLRTQIIVVWNRLIHILVCVSYIYKLSSSETAWSTSSCVCPTYTNYRRLKPLDPHPRVCVLHIQIIVVWNSLVHILVCVSYIYKLSSSETAWSTSSCVWPTYTNYRCLKQLGPHLRVCVLHIQIIVVWNRLVHIFVCMAYIHKLSSSETAWSTSPCVCPTYTNYRRLKPLGPHLRVYGLHTQIIVVWNRLVHIFMCMAYIHKLSLSETAWSTSSCVCPTYTNYRRLKPLGPHLRVYGLHIQIIVVWNSLVHIPVCVSYIYKLSSSETAWSTSSCVWPTYTNYRRLKQLGPHPRVCVLHIQIIVVWNRLVHIFVCMAYIHKLSLSEMMLWFNFLFLTSGKIFTSYCMCPLLLCIIVELKNIVCDCTSCSWKCCNWYTKYHLNEECSTMYK